MLSHSHGRPVCVFVGVLKTNVISTRLPLATTWLRLSIQLRLQRVTFSIACFQAALPVSLACHCLWQWQQQPQQHQQQLLALCCCFCCCSSCYCFPFLQPFLCAGIADGLWVLMFLRYVHCERGERGREIPTRSHYIFYLLLVLNSCGIWPGPGPTTQPFQPFVLVQQSEARSRNQSDPVYVHFKCHAHHLPCECLGCLVMVAVTVTVTDTHNSNFTINDSHIRTVPLPNSICKLHENCEL